MISLMWDGYCEVVEVVLVMVCDLVLVGVDVIVYVCIVGSLCDGVEVESVLIMCFVVVLGKFVFSFVEMLIVVLCYVGVK